MGKKDKEARGKGGGMSEEGREGAGRRREGGRDRRGQGAMKREMALRADRTAAVHVG